MHSTRHFDAPRTRPHRAYEENEMTLEEFIMAFDPMNCCACARFGFSWPPPLQSSFLDYIRAGIEEREKVDPDEAMEPLITAQDLADYVDDEHERADCILLLEAFEKANQ